MSRSDYDYYDSAVYPLPLRHREMRVKASRRGVRNEKFIFSDEFGTSIHVVRAHIQRATEDCLDELFPLAKGVVDDLGPEDQLRIRITINQMEPAEDDCD